MAVEVLRRRFTVDEYYRMAEAGILSRDDRVELIDGEVVRMTPIGPRHASCVMRLTTLLPQLAADYAIISVQNPVRLGTYDEPQPDVVVLAKRQDFYRHAHPGPSDTLLVIEVADTSIEYDRTRKLERYALSGVPEVWIVNLGENLVEVYRRLAENEYRERVAVGPGQSLSVPGAADRFLAVDDILGSRS